MTVTRNGSDSMHPFQGWPPEAMAWFEGIEKDNSKEFFQAHRPTYEMAVRRPLSDLLAQLADEFGESKVFRPHRDVRFSADKSPYRTNAAAVSRRAGSVAVYYVEISAKGLLAASGYHEMTRAQLAAYRAAVANDTRGRRLEDIVADAEASGATLTGETLKTAPRGFPRDHPRARLLRHNEVILTRVAPPGLMHTPLALGWVADTWRSAARLVEWLDENAGPT